MRISYKRKIIAEINKIGKFPYHNKFNLNIESQGSPDQYQLYVTGVRKDSDDIETVALVYVNRIKECCGASLISSLWTDWDFTDSWGTNTHGKVCDILLKWAEDFADLHLDTSHMIYYVSQEQEEEENVLIDRGYGKIDQFLNPNSHNEVYLYSFYTEHSDENSDPFDN